jgi:DNA-binding NarL/FixJ family response regulator
MFHHLNSPFALTAGVPLQRIENRLALIAERIHCPIATDHRPQRLDQMIESALDLHREDIKFLSNSPTKRQLTTHPQTELNGMVDFRISKSRNSPKAPMISFASTEASTSQASGASNKEIADRLNLAEGIVKDDVTKILTKLDVRDRTQAALRARQLGIV